MTALQQSPEMIAIARDLGVEIDKEVTFDPKNAILKVAQQLEGAEVTFGSEDAEFGSLFSKIFKKSPASKLHKQVIKKMASHASTPQQKAAIQALGKADVKFDAKGTAKGLGQIAKTAGKVAAVASFVVPGVGPLVGGSALAAMSAADKLLGDPKVKNAAQLISNTKALAAMGNVPARRGAAALAAVAQIRQKTGAKPGQAVIKPRPSPLRPAPRAPAVNTALYVQAVPRTQVKALATQAIATAPKKSFWQKLKELFS
jgi:hypothetical protein